MMTAWLVILGVGCGDDGGRADEVRAFVQSSFEQRFGTGPTGPVGVEAAGKGVWWRIPAFDAQCLRDKQFAFRDQKPGVAPRISPTYPQQVLFQAPTEEGFCVYLGDDLAMTAGEVELRDGVWVVDTAFSVGKAGPWWDCVDSLEKNRPVRVLESAEGELALEADPALYGGGCPVPLPLVNMERKATSRPAAAPPGSPSVEDMVAAARRLDDALYEGNLQAAMDATACYNLYEENKFGSCSAAELASVGPITRDGQPRRQDGPPWTMNAFDDLSEIGRAKRDKSDPTLFHSVVKAGTLKHPKRTVSFQWVDGSWKIVGVVQRKAEGLTSAEFVTNLGRSDQRDIFERRMAGEDIDYRGLPPIKDEEVE